MIPDLMYHGTFKRFEKFARENFRQTAYCGPGVYLTNEFDDAYGFYADENSGDTLNKIDEKVNEFYDDDADYDDLYEKAKQEVCGDGNFVYHCRPKVSNPIVMCKNRSNGTFINLWTYNEELDDIEYTNEFHVISDILGNYNIEFVPDDPEIATQDLYEICQQLRHWDDVTPGEIFQEVVQELGYDSILMRYVEAYFSMYCGYYDLHHLIIFSPDNVEIVRIEEV